MLRKLMLVSLAVGGVWTLGICIPFDAAGQGSGGGILPPGGETLQGGAITLEELAELDSANSVIDQRLRLLRTTLAKRIALNLREVSLQDALRSLAQKADFHLEIDTRAIEGENLTSELNEEELTLENPDISVRSALNFLLHVRDLDWIIRDESVTITTRTAADQKLETAVYDVSNLVAEDNGLTDLIDAIQSTIEPSAWESLGGEGSLRAVGNLLVIRQSQRMHDEIALLLVKLGKVATKNSPQANGGAAGDQMSVKVYGVNRRGAEELADVITTILEPNSWKASGGEGVVRSVEDAIIVYQSARMHSRVRRLLADLPNRVDSATNVGTQGQAGGFFQSLDTRQSSAPGRNRSQEPERQRPVVR